MQNKYTLRNIEFSYDFENGRIKFEIVLMPNFDLKFLVRSKTVIRGDIQKKYNVRGECFGLYINIVNGTRGYYEYNERFFSENNRNIRVISHPTIPEHMDYMVHRELEWFFYDLAVWGYAITPKIFNDWGEAEVLSFHDLTDEEIEQAGIDCDGNCDDEYCDCKETFFVTHNEVIRNQDTYILTHGEYDFAYSWGFHVVKYAKYVNGKIYMGFVR